MCRAHGAVAQNAGQFFIFVGLGNALRWASDSSASCRYFNDVVIVGLILGQVPVGLRFLQVLILGVGCLRDLLE